MKAMTVMAGAALLGSTMASALYPTGFTSNTAVIVGANAAPSDNLASATVISHLNAAKVGEGGNVEIDGEKYKFDKSATHFHIGDDITDVVSTALDDDQLPTLLEAGTYTDTNNDEFEYTQKITVGTTGLQLNLFEDDDYKADTPTVGFRIPSATTVATYTLDFTDQPDFADLENTDLNIMGKQYYVLDAPTTNDRLTLLDSAQDSILAEGSSVTVNAGSKTYTVETSFVGETSVKLVVNGETTNSLAEGSTYKLSDGSYIGVKDIMYSSKDTGISKVEFSIGNGKLLLINGDEVELNEDEVDGVTVTVTNNSAKLDKIDLAWATDDTMFITTDRALVMPGFETFKFVYGGVDFPAEEKIEIQAGSSTYSILNDFPLKGAEEDIPLLYLNTSLTGFAGTGKSSTQKLATGTTSITFDSNTDWFIVSYTGTKDSESYLARATGFSDSAGVNKTTIEYRKDGSWVSAITDGEVGDEFDIGSAELNITGITDSTETATIANASAATSFNVLYSKEGLKITLPVFTANGVYPNVNSTAANPTSYVLKMQEEDKDGTIAAGDTINATISINTDGDVHISDVTGDVTEIEDGDGSDKFVTYQYSDLATKSVHDRSGDQQKVILTYHGDEVTADVYVAAMAASTSTSSGVKTYTDTNVAMADGMNLIVVGGSAINSVAAELLGGAYREAAFTTATNVKAGEFLIQSFDRSGKMALLVAGYNADDTTKAVAYLTNEDVDTTVGKKYIGTSATEATLVTV